jgi:hypothetical protein
MNWVAVSSSVENERNLKEDGETRKLFSIGAHDVIYNLS